MWPRRYAEDMERAWNHVRVVPSEQIQTPFGRLEYAQQGEGVPVLMSHGIWGCHAEGIGMVSTYLGSGYRAIAPSRFGYFGTALPHNATPADQADAHRFLLDHLQTERVVAVGYSAGSASAIQLALRHLDRLHGLILIAAHLPGLPTPRRLVHPLLRAAFGWERIFWVFKSVMPRTFSRLTGVPKGWRPTAGEAATIREVSQSMFPIKPRHRGATFDSLVSNPAVNAVPLEDVRTPTLIIRAIDDPYSPGATVDNDAARRIPGARLVRIERGGHLFLGREAQVRNETGAFIQSVIPKEPPPA
jgi:pimeloyl-ACP methyl ester carboxylesterase